MRAGFTRAARAQNDIEVVGEAVDGARPCDLTVREQPDVVLMDIRMPDVDGLDATRRIAATSASPPSTRVVILTTFDLDEYVFEALRAGASGFLREGHRAGRAACQAVRVVADGEALLSPRSPAG